MNYQKTGLFLIPFAILLSCSACEMLNSQKAQEIQKIKSESCNDVNGILKIAANSFIPLAGGEIWQATFEATNAESYLCPCIESTVAARFGQNLELETLQSYNENPLLRKQKVLSFLLEEKDALLSCYQKDNQGKGQKILKQVLNTLDKNYEKIKRKVEKELD